MTLVRLKGLNRVRKRRADGSETVYWYAWKGGPRLPGKPNSTEFMAAYDAALAARKAPASDTLAGLVTLYKSKPEYLQLGASTRREWTQWLDRIVVQGKTRQGVKWGLGDLPMSRLDDTRVRAFIMDWRDQWAASPRTADYGIQVLSRVLGFAVQRGLLSMNRAAGIPHLYDADRADLIWDAADLARFCAAAPPPVTQALRLACLTGLRRGDLVKLQWRHVGDLAIEIPTNKSGRKRIATIPLLAEAKALLAEIGRRGALQTVLTNAHGGQWGVGSLSHRIGHFAGQVKVERSLHDARGTFATRLRMAGLTADEIAGIMGWEVDQVERILARYVDQARVIRALVNKVERNERRAQAPNFLPTAPADDT